MKSVLMSIQPKWCELIASGKKTIEVRKTKPKLEVPFKVYIYCTQEKRLLHKFDKGERIDDEHFFEEHVFVRKNTWIRGHFNPNGKVIGEFICNRIEKLGWFATLQDSIWIDRFDADTCLTNKELYEYTKGKLFYMWHISNLVIYDKPKGLSDFSKYGFDRFVSMERPPQSWCYVEGGN